MFISIIVPVYNGEKYIQECIDSLTSQTSSLEFEIIVVDDGSTDRTFEFCSLICKANNTVRYVKQMNSGVSSARNKGLELAIGEWIIYVDADDFVKTNMLDIIQRNTISSDADVIVFSQNLSKSIVFTGEKIDLVKATLGLKIIFRNTYLPCAVSKAYRRKFLIEENINFNINISNGEDMLFTCRVYLLAKKILMIRESFYSYRQNAGSVTYKYDESCLANDIAFLAELKKILENYFNKIESNIIFSAAACAGFFSVFKRLIIHEDNNNNFSNRLQMFRAISCKEPYFSSMVDFNFFKSFNFDSRTIFSYGVKMKMHALILILFKIRQKIYSRKAMIGTVINI